MTLFDMFQKHGANCRSFANKYNIVVYNGRNAHIVYLNYKHFAVGLRISFDVDSYWDGDSEPFAHVRLHSISELMYYTLGKESRYLREVVGA